MTTTARTTTSVRTRLAGTVIERQGWILVLLLAALLLFFGLTGFGGDSPHDAISGSGCCNGHRFDTLPGWAFQYLSETFDYQATFQIGMGLFAVTLLVFGVRRGAAWAWAVCWYFPIMFAIHAFVLGSGVYDIVTGAITLVGQLLMMRPVFGRRVEVPQRIRGERAA